jgi:hypothetical protein
VAEAQRGVRRFPSQAPPLRFWPECKTQGDPSPIRSMLQSDDPDKSARLPDRPHPESEAPPGGNVTGQVLGGLSVIANAAEHYRIDQWVGFYRSKVSEVGAADRSENQPTRA